MSEYPDFKAIRDALTAEEFRFTRRWGQNFLTERKLLAAIVAAAEVGPDDLVLEVGTGPGCLTFPLLRTGASVVGIEIDRKLYEIGTRLLKEKAPEEARHRMTWLHKDFLKDKNRVDDAIMAEVREGLQNSESRQFKVVSNLPYAIAVPVIMNIMECGMSWRTMVVTIQQELGDRFTALPGTKAYGAVRVLAESLAQVQILRKLPAAAFWPRPKVASCVVKFTPRYDIFERTGSSYGAYKETTRRIFAYRRKTWFKSLKTASSRSECQHFDEAGSSCGIAPGRRAEDLSNDEILELSRFFSPFFDSPAL